MDHERTSTQSHREHPPVALACAPAPGSRFSHSLRNEKSRWWKPLVGVIVGVLLFLAVSVFLTVLAVVYETMANHGSFDPQSMTPLMYAAALAGLVVLIPIAILMQRIVHGQAIGQLFSVQGRLRWRWLGLATAVILLPFLAYLALFQYLAPQNGSRADNWLVYLLVGVLLMPFQAAAEEIFFRGYVQRAVGTWFSAERSSLIVGTLISALIFMAAHFAQDPWLIGYYFAFGATLSILAHYTGGLEAGIAIHVVNNVVAGAYGALTQDPSSMFDRSAGTGGPFMLVQIAAIALFAYALYRLARRQRLAVRYQPTLQAAGAAPSTTPPQPHTEAGGVADRRG
ncbi:CPBP family intramembrane glutamic endopeptidase [Gephyromycinifex aptenodytis]|uniref:CPBP family intramembrane glutamic endopeptidase n=1 Tax=Gephyromycinifex aptenodytis TaxID=2716227 RepID=UPI001446FEB0|nr:type II CAAX endopeptidase family protein [Gephyromycinifex aptenodytis]